MDGRVLPAINGADRNATDRNSADADAHRFRLDGAIGRRTASVILAIGLAATILGWQSAEDAGRAWQQSHLVERSAVILANLKERLAQYEILLRSAAALLSDPGRVHQENWQNLVTSLQIPAAFPGLERIAYVALVPAPALSAFLDDLRAEGRSRFSISPPGDRAEYCPVVFWDGLGVDKTKLGLDVCSSAEYGRATYDAARASGQPTLSPRVSMVQNYDGRKYGHLMVVPVGNPAAAARSAEEGQPPIRGWVTAVWNLDTLMRSINSAGSTIDIEVYDGPDATADAQLFDSDTVIDAPLDEGHDPQPRLHRPTYREVVTIGGHQLTLWFSEEHAQAWQPWTVLAAGLSTTLMLFAMVKSLAGTRSEALRLANRLSRESRARERRYRTLVEAIPHGVFRAQRNGDITFSNAALARLFGLTPEALIGQRLSDFAVDDQERRRLKRFHAQPPADAIVPAPWIGHLRLPNGRLADLQIDLAFEFDDSGAQTGFIAIITDVTQRQRTEAALYESRANLQAVFDATTDAVGLVGRDRRLLAINRAAAQRFGQTAEACAGRSLDEVVPAEARQHFTPMLDEAFETGQPLEREYFRLGRWIKTQLYPILDSRGSVVRTAIYSRDTTERKIAEQALQVSEARFRLIADAAPLPLVVAGHPSGNILFANRATSRLLGVAPQDLPGMSLEAFWFKPADYRDTIAQTAEGSTIENLELRLRRHGGGPFWAVMSAQPTQFEDCPAMIASFVDVTELKEVQRGLVEARELADAANLAKSEFLASVSHELRTPMNAILGFGQLLLDGLDGSAAQKQRDYLTIILKAGEHLLTLINEVLDLARIEAERFEFKIENLCVQDAMPDCLALVEGLAQRHNVAVIDRISKHRAVAVRTDATAFKRILLNLLSNGIKYNQPGGRVVIDCTPAPYGEMLRITVLDTGIGIARDKQDQLFQPFNRLGAEGSEIEGTGIGLAVTRKLIKLVGGNIGFQSEAGQGSVFWVDLPFASKTEPQWEGNPPAQSIDEAAPGCLI
ncbi:MAG: PAS domain S-box protein [Azospirillum sp.]|nr:PAS domain S-box protein [Azospirillum sp.]